MTLLVTVPLFSAFNDGHFFLRTDAVLVQSVCESSAVVVAETAFFAQIMSRYCQEWMFVTCVCVFVFSVLVS